MTTQKKIYETPKINQVKLVVKESVLGTCHDSPTDFQASSTQGCRQVPCLEYIT